MSEKISVSVEVEDKFSAAFDKMTQKTDELNKSLEKVSDQSQKTTSKTELLTKSLVGAAVAFGGFATIKNLINEFALAEAATNKLNTAFNNSKGIGLTREQLTKYQQELEKTSIFSGEAIQEIQTRLINFGKIGGENFKTATQAALDFAAATGQDAGSSAQLLGKALANPIEGMNQLKRAGVNFSAEQQNLIEQSVKYGDLQKAQKVILDEVTSKFKGQAEAQRLGTGSLVVLTEQFGNFKEELGQVLFNLLEPFIAFLNNSAIPFITKFAKEIVILVGSLTGLVLVVKGVTLAMNGLAVAMAFLQTVNPWIAAISLTVAGVVAAFALWNEKSLEIKRSLFELKIAAIEAFSQITIFGKQFTASMKENLAEAKEDLKRFNAENRNEAIEDFRRRRAEKKAEQQKEAEEVKKWNSIEKAMSKDLLSQKRIDEKKAAEEKFNEKLKEYDNLSALEIQFLKESEQRSRQNKTRQLQLERMSYDMLTQEDKDFINKREEFDVKAQNESFKKNQKLQKREMDLTEKYGSERAKYFMKEEQELTDEKLAQENKKAAIENNIGNARVKANMEALELMSQLQTVKSKEMFEIGKAAAIATAIINTKQGITATLRDYPFPLSAAMAAAQAALGYAQVQQISSQSLAFEDGGIVPGNSYSGDMVQARVNSGEMILNQRQQKAMFEALDKGAVSGSSQPQQINYVNNVKIYGNGDKFLKNQIEKTIDKKEKRRLQKQQFVKGRF